MCKGVCVVVGVGPGNGAAIGAQFAANGYRVALCARNKERLNEISGKIKGSRAFPYDVKDVEASSKVFAQIREQVGPVNVLIYNAGAGTFANIDDATLESFQDAWEINCRGLFHTVKEVLPDMRAAGSGERGAAILSLLVLPPRLKVAPTSPLLRLRKRDSGVWRSRWQDTSDPKKSTSVT